MKNNGNVPETSELKVLWTKLRNKTILGCITKLLCFWMELIVCVNGAQNLRNMCESL